MDPVHALAPAPILIPLGAAFLLPLAGHVAGRLRGVLASLAMALTLAALAVLAGPVLRGETIVYWMSGWMPRDGLAIGISLSIDAWSLLFALIVAVAGLASVVYSGAYLQAETGRGLYYTLLLLVCAALIGFCLSGDLFNQFVWLEVFSVAGFALTGFHVDRPEAAEAAFKYLITNSVAALFISTALALLYMQTGALNLAQVAQAFRPTPAGLVAAGLLIGGYATKAAIVPWHFWLADAYGAAPAPFCALSSGAVIKVGMYAIARSALTLFALAPGSGLQGALLAAAALSIAAGSVQMIRQQSPLRILAFSSVAQMGYILLGLALATPPGLAAALLHALQHALVKSALFLGAGAVVWRTGRHRLDELGGLARRMPVTCALMVLAAVGLAGLPPGSGFVSKALLEEAAGAAGYAPLGWLAVLGSIFTFAGLLRLLWLAFAPRPGRAPQDVREAPVRMLLPMAALVGLSFAIGLYPQWPLEHLAGPAAAALGDRAHYITAVLAPTGVAANPLPPVTIAAPDLLAPARWLVLLVVAIGGGLLAYALLKPISPRHLLARMVRPVGQWLGDWHSGVVSDYALWVALGTAIVTVVLLANSP